MLRCLDDIELRVGDVFIRQLHREELHPWWKVFLEKFGITCALDSFLISSRRRIILRHGALKLSARIRASSSDELGLGQCPINGPIVNDFTVHDFVRGIFQTQRGGGSGIEEEQCCPSMVEVNNIPLGQTIVDLRPSTSQSIP